MVSNGKPVLKSAGKHCEARSFLLKSINMRGTNHAESLHNDACFIVIATAGKALAWEKKLQTK